MSAPSLSEIKAYRLGQLSPSRFSEIEQWLDQQTPQEVERLLEQAGGDETGTLHQVKVSQGAQGFVADAGSGRLRLDDELGVGGMAHVVSARDRSLDRVVALKTLKPRQAHESLEHYHLREASFRREAAVTAALEHPAIVPVYDLGRADGQPAFTMKRLSGETLFAVVTAGKRSRLELVEGLLRVAEAVAYAHSRGVVHRDLTPTNILLSDYGAIYVLDWGVAARCGEGDGVSVGTPAWMAPEQATGAVADPRMDVFALGGLLLFILTGREPRQGQVIDLAPLQGREVPPGLAALARRCLASSPQERYADANVVANELRRWLDEGMTLAQDAGPLAYLWVRLRRSPQARGAFMAGIIAVIILTTMVWWTSVQQRTAATLRIQQLQSEVALDQPEALSVALDEVRHIAMNYPDIPLATSLLARWQTALELARDQETLAKHTNNFAQLLARWRRSGPWPEEITDWQKVLLSAGLDVLTPSATAVAVLRTHPLRLQMVQGLIHLWYAAKAGGDDAMAKRVATIVISGGPSDGWKALGRLLARTEFQAHQPVFCECAESEGALSDPASASAVLAIYGPDHRLVDFARKELAREPGSFWPLMASAQAALNANDLSSAERQALIASGSEPGSMYPPMLMAYVALARGDFASVVIAAERGLHINPQHSELLVLKAAGLAGSGNKVAAQAMVDQLDAGHLQYHLQHRVGHPMERGVDALVAAGLTIPKADPRLGPLVPHHH
jgi:tRNA A-37 threonylcarbamoyl transferase component Bud32